VTAYDATRGETPRGKDLASFLSYVVATAGPEPTLEQRLSRGTIIALVWTVLAAVSLSCGSTLPAPKTTSHHGDAYEVVPYPPPSALVEIVPDSPNARAVWVDGYWVWHGRYYVWERGGWVEPPTGARLALWDAHYLETGVLLYAPTIWRDAQGRTLEPPVLLPAGTPPTQETAEPATVP
jgi:hypothetical protein